jgi:hypothetical protein
MNINDIVNAYEHVKYNNNINLLKKAYDISQNHQKMEREKSL